jgi:hypothetical protein
VLEIVLLIRRVRGCLENQTGCWGVWCGVDEVSRKLCTRYQIPRLAQPGGLQSISAVRGVRLLDYSDYALGGLLILLAQDGPRRCS